MPENSIIFQPPLPFNAGHTYYWDNLQGASLALAISYAIKQSPRHYLIIVKDTQSANTLLEELQFFCHTSHSIDYFPDWETLPYDHFSPHKDIVSERLSLLSKLSSKQSGITITTIATLMQPLPPLDFIVQNTLIMRHGDKINHSHFRAKLIQAGYHIVNQVREHGEVAIRGSIIDLYPMGSHSPYRLDLLDDEIDSIRTFSPDTQLSLKKIDDISLLPAKEYPLTEESIEYFRQNFRSHFRGNPLNVALYQDVSEGLSPPGIEYYLPLFFKTCATLFDYLPESLIIKIGDIQHKGEEIWQDIIKRYDQNSHNITRPILPPQIVFTPIDKLNGHIKKYPTVIINGATAKTTHSYRFDTEATPCFNINHKNVQPLADLQNYLKDKTGRILFIAESLGRREILMQLLATIKIAPIFFPSWQDFLLNDNTTLGITIGNLENGFISRDHNIILIAESELFGKRIMQRRLRQKEIHYQETILKSLVELKINDPVVHLNHGIGYYRGLQTLTIGSESAEFLMLEYQGNDKVYVPVASLHLINRYTGVDENIPINKLGTDTWHKAKKRAVEKVNDVAAELLDLYAKRALHHSEPYQLNQDDYAIFAAAFPFEETPDQLTAIEQVFSDLMSDKPMDRVICGDVGFGKTEVAMRATFLVTQNNKQVVILAPTTLLAQQHYENFRDRFADWPIVVDVLSRFRTAKETKLVLDKLSSGKIDIIIGTHKLLQDTVKYKNLGLIIIDEEHRFGVKQKEKIKSLRVSVDILTMTATPIPRTLNLALSGIRDLSLIATPPQKRLSVKTFVHEYNNDIIKEAVSRELLRGGQVYFIHNDLRTINHKSEEIKKLIPESRPEVAHGQMHERELENVMSLFYHRQINVLVCSTIVESGIDIPTANTIVINRADRFGLAQLHQLRGRVGRSHHQAYAYLLTPPAKLITNDAQKRLDAISSLDELGVGFTLATHDLEIRGAGELLGENQSGNMHEVGFTLYMDLLTRAVDALKNGVKIDLEKSLTEHNTEIDLHISALIPENYLHDVQLRLQFYKKIASAPDETTLDQIQVEMIDRFGLLPQPIKNLMRIAILKLRATTLGVLKIEANDQTGRFEFMDHPKIKPERIIQLIQQKDNRFRLDGPNRLRFTLPRHESKDRIELINNLLTEIST